MNIFILSENPIEAAQLHCDKHVVKMIVEVAQQLSTAHRVLDGKMSIQLVPSKKNPGKIRKKKIYDHPVSELYQATHINHPCAVWVRQSTQNYLWLYQHFCALSMEYLFRYGKNHATHERLSQQLSYFPEKLPSGSLTSFALAMKSDPECIDLSNPVKSYRAFYKTKLKRFKMVWTKREIPAWFLARTPIDEMLIEMIRDPEKMKIQLTFTPDEIKQETGYFNEFYDVERRNIMEIMSDLVANN